ncbi:MAG TPA: Txe/YoeB family addiction module toxin [Limosilactobacillus coleohominis]|nr:Txe/YoeB family addiction module toxin [Limosilactobacillus coleohominis]
MTKLNIVFTQDAWQEYLTWKNSDRKIVRRIDKLINDTVRNPFSGIGKPEPLQHDLSGFWSKKINDEHRMVYGVTKSAIQIVQLRYHYHK